MASDNPSGNQFFDVPVTLTISVGHTTTDIGSLLNLEKDAVLTLDKKVEDPVTLYAGTRMVAYGELQEDENGQLAVRITELAEPEGD